MSICTDTLPSPTSRTIDAFSHTQALKFFIQSYFADDVEFNKNVEKNTKLVFDRRLRETRKDLSYMTLKEAIKISCDVEDAKRRKPVLLNASHLVPIEPAALVQELRINPETKIESFRGAVTTPQEMIESVVERSKYKKRYPITVVADLPFTSKVKDDLADRIKQHIKWNALIFNSDFEQTSLVLSDTDALATPHIHPNMFWNCALCGTKTYLLVDIDEFANKFDKTRTELPWTEKSVYKSTISFTGRITFEEFKMLKNAYFAVISSEGPNFLLVPTRYMHEVWTVCGGPDGIYGGLVGGAMPRSITYQKATEAIRKDQSMVSFFGKENIDDWFKVEDNELDVNMVDGAIIVKKEDKPKVKYIQRKRNGKITRVKDETEDDEDLTKEHCICRGFYDPELWMICCDECEVWFHGKCLNMKKSMSDSIASYVCANCEASTGKTSIMKNKKRRKKC